MSNEHPNAKIAPGGSLVLSVVGSVAAWLSRGALADAEYSLKKAREIGQATTLIFALAFTSFTHILCGHYAIANIQSDELAAVAHQKGTVLWGAWSIMNQGCVLALTDKVSDAVQTIIAGITACRSTGMTLLEPRILSLLAKSLCGTWSIRGLLAKHQRSDDGRRDDGGEDVEAEVNRTAGEIALLSPEPDAARISSGRSWSRASGRQNPGNCAR